MSRKQRSSKKKSATKAPDKKPARGGSISDGTRQAFNKWKKHRFLYFQIDAIKVIITEVNVEENNVRFRVCVTGRPRPYHKAEWDCKFPTTFLDEGCMIRNGDDFSIDYSNTDWLPKIKVDSADDHAAVFLLYNRLKDREGYAEYITEFSISDYMESDNFRHLVFFSITFMEDDDETKMHAYLPAKFSDIRRDQFPDLAHHDPDDKKDFETNTFLGLRDPDPAIQVTVVSGLDEWDAYPSATAYVQPKTRDEDQYNKISMGIGFSHNPWTFIKNNFFLNFLLVYLSYMGLWFDPAAGWDRTAARLTILITLFLTAVAARIQSSSAYGYSGRRNYLEWYAAACFIVLAALMFQTILVSKLSASTDPDVRAGAVTFDSCIRWIFGIGWPVVNSLIFVSLFCGCCYPKWDDLASDQVDLYQGKKRTCMEACRSSKFKATKV